MAPRVTHLVGIPCQATSSAVIIAGDVDFFWEVAKHETARPVHEVADIALHDHVVDLAGDIDSFADGLVGCVALHGFVV